MATLLNIMKCNHNVTVSLVLCGFKIKAHGVLARKHRFVRGGVGVGKGFWGFVVTTSFREIYFKTSNHLK